jgi:hypothetical protein
VGTAQGAELDISFPNIGTAATFVYVENKSGQELGMAWGGNFYPDLPNGGVILLMFPEAPVQGVMTGFRFFLRQAQTTVGQVNFVVGGS